MSHRERPWRISRRSRSITALLWAMPFMCVGWTGCNQVSTEATDSPKVASIQSASTVKIQPVVLERSGILAEPITRGTFRTHRDFPGVVTANDTKLAEVTALVRGRVIEVYKSLGDDVKVGDLLALLFSRELGLAQSHYLKAIAGLRVAEQAFMRAKYLVEEKVIGEGEFQRREGQLMSARADASEAKDQLAQLGMRDQDIAKLEREQTIRSHVPIVSPLSGRIIGRDVTQGEVVETSRHLFTIADLANVWVVANVPEQDLAFIHHATAGTSTKAEVLLSAYPDQTMIGEVTHVGDVLRPGTRTLALRVEVPNRDGRLKPEMFASVRIWTPPVKDVLTIPVAAVQRDRGEPVVFVELSNGVFSRRVVELGEVNDKQVRVTGGLEEGELVVVAGAYVVKSEFASQIQGGLVE